MENHDGACDILARNHIVLVTGIDPVVRDDALLVNQPVSNLHPSGGGAIHEAGRHPPLVPGTADDVPIVLSPAIVLRLLPDLSQGVSLRGARSASHGDAPVLHVPEVQPPEERRKESKLIVRWPDLIRLVQVRVGVDREVPGGGGAGGGGGEGHGGEENGEGAREKGHGALQSFIGALANEWSLSVNCIVEDTVCDEKIYHNFGLLSMIYTLFA